MENTEKQEEVIQEVETQEQPVEEQAEAVSEDISYSEMSEDGTVKLDLTKLKQFQEQNESTEEQSADEVLVRDESGTSEEVSEENKEKQIEELTGQSEEEKEVVLEEVTQEEILTETQQIEEPVIEQEPILEQPQVVVPENLQSLVNFMEETGGSLEDYVRLNADYSNVDNDSLLIEYYKTTKPQ